MHADNKTIYTFYNSFIFSDEKDTVIFRYDGDEKIGTFGHDDNGQLRVGPDSVLMGVNYSDTVLIISKSSSDVFHVEHGGDEYLKLDTNSDTFHVSSITNPYIVRGVNDPIIDVDAVNKRYVDKKVPYVSMTMVATSTKSTQGSTLMVIKGTSDSRIVPSEVVNGSSAHLVEIKLLIKDDCPAKRRVSLQTYTFGACTEVGNTLTIGNTNMRALINNYITAADYNITIATTSNYFEIYFNYASSIDLYTAEAYLHIYCL